MSNTESPRNTSRAVARRRAALRRMAGIRMRGTLPAAHPATSNAAPAATALARNVLINPTTA